MTEIHTTRPLFVGGSHAGRSFRDTAGLSLDQTNLLARQKVIHLTAFAVEDGLYGGDVIAESRSQAEAIMRRRGFGERYVGPLVRVLPVRDDEEPA
ncbi:hypothetical protein [Methylobacterium planeticum]|uniref:Uncharacterized protein n=1 Tax=Methylobacterium planeticum TaxID=2615211 RepID=A0A6N6MDI4_9HYPH|nr:hypothetical protein [Methylobacterium planeticum]KAB1068751.1 hypothetical protein F6X51_26440 [Methylobacterium planeticum]